MGMDDTEDSDGSLNTDLQVQATTRLIEALYESEARMRRRVNLLSEVVFELDLEGRIVFLNSAWSQSLGLSEASSLGQPLGEFAWPEDRDRLQATLAGAQPSNPAPRALLRFCGTGTVLRWMEMSAVQVPGQGFVGALRDVTQQKLAQDELERMSLVANHTDNLVLITNAMGRVEWVNAAFTRHTGYSLAEMLGKVPGHVLQGPSTDQAEIARLGQEIRAGRSVRSEILNVKRSGELYWVTLYITPIRDESGVIQRFISVQSDSTALRQMRSDLEYEKLRAEAANRAKSAFLATMSHEIRTPMNSILGMAQTLMDPTLESGQRQDYVRILMDSGETLLALLNDILDLSRIEAGKLVLHRTRIAPLQLINDTLALFNSSAHAKQLALKVISDLEPSRYYQIDALRLRQMLSNLISNAIKFTSSGSIEVTVTQLARGEDGDELEFAVTDTGVGIDLADQAALFGTFSQVDSSSTRHFGGAGLGLSIVKSLAQSMGGTVGVRSSPGQGSRFWFCIKAVRDFDVLHQPAALPVNVTEVTQGRIKSTFLEGQGRVLLAEDNAVNRLVMSAHLAKFDLSVRLAENGQQAVALGTSSERFDCILMDVRMPHLDGLDATRQIRAWERLHGYPRCPIIAVTANAFSEDQRECEAAGMDDFISKPVLMADLQRALLRWLPEVTTTEPG
jgi:PAS domain S-box-containing protein